MSIETPPSRVVEKAVILLGVSYISIYEIFSVRGYGLEIIPFGLLLSFSC